MKLTNALLGVSCLALIGLLNACGDASGDVANSDSKSVVSTGSSGSGAQGTDESLQFTATSYVTASNASSISIPVTRVGGTAGSVSVTYKTANGTAIAGTTYAAVSGTLTWADGDGSTKSILVRVDAAGFSGTRTFSVVLANPGSGAILGSPATATVSVSGAAALATQSVALGASAYNAASGATSVTLLVVRQGGANGALSVNYSTSNGTATAGTTYTAQSGTLTWPAGNAAAKTIVVPVSTSGFSGTRTFYASLSNAANGAVLGTPTKATVTVNGAMATTAASVAFTSSSFTTVQTAGSANLTVNRQGGTTGSVAVAYATSNGTATAGMNYTPQSGTLTWAAGDTSAKSIVIPITSTVISAPVSFNVALSNPSGANIGTPARASVTINKAVSTNTGFSIAVSGNHLVDANGNTVQLRGVNVAGLESVAIQGWDPSNPWGGSTGQNTPDWALMKTWGINAVRLPINEASWLGSQCRDVGGYGVHFVNGAKVNNTPGELVSADPGGNYRATVATTVSEATAAGLYVILDLHLAAPSNVCPTMQNPMADGDNAINFWSTLASVYKSNPAVIFELFNEPFLDQVPVAGNDPWQALIDGGTLSWYRAQTPNNPWYTQVNYTWQTAGMQQMLNAVRATGATNVILTSTLAYSSSLGGWLQYHPTDTLNPSQIAAVWHAYPSPDAPNAVNCIGLPACSAQTLSDATAILNAGYPVVVTEYGDPSGGSTAPWSSVLLPFADSQGISYFGWTWDPWTGTTFYLITDGNGDPSQGFGTYVKAHYQCRAAGNTSCK